MAAPRPNQQSTDESQVASDVAGQHDNTVNATSHHVNPDNHSSLHTAQYTHDDDATGMVDSDDADSDDGTFSVTIPVHVPGYANPQPMLVTFVPESQLIERQRQLMQTLQNDPFTTNNGSFGSLHYPTGEGTAPVLPVHGAHVGTSHGHVTVGHHTPDTTAIKQGQTSITAAQPRPTTFAEFIKGPDRPSVQFGQMSVPSVFSRSMPETDRGPTEEISDDDEASESGLGTNSAWEVETPTRKIDSARGLGALTVHANNADAALGPASPSPAMISPAMQQLHFHSMAEAEAAAEVESSAWKSVALQVKDDDWRDVEANPQVWVYWIVQAFNQPYHRQPVDGTTTLTGDCLAEWLLFQEEHKLKAEKATKDARTLEISAWMVLRTVLDTHRTGARVLKKFVVDVDTKCSARLRAVCQTLADYPIVRFDVLRGQRVNNLAANPALVGARKIVNFRGNYGKAVTSRSGGGPSAGRGARGRRHSPSHDDEEDDAVVAATPSRGSKKRKASAGSGGE